LWYDDSKLTSFFIANEKRWQREREKSLILAGKIKAEKIWVGWKWELLFALVIGQEAVLFSPQMGSKIPVHVL